MAGKGNINNLKPWKKGQSGNPGGRPKAAVDVSELARDLCPQAIQVLANLMLDEKTPATVRATSAQALLDRGCGKPMVSIQAEHTGSVELLTQTVEAIAQSTDAAEAARLYAQLIAQPAPTEH